MMRWVVDLQQPLGRLVARRSPLYYYDYYYCFTARREDGIKEAIEVRDSEATGSCDKKHVPDKKK